MPEIGIQDNAQTLKGSLLIDSSEDLAKLIEEQKEHDIKDLEIIFSGDEKVIKEKIAALNYNGGRYSIIHAPDEISCNDKPTEAIKLKKESSLYKALELLRADDTVGALVSNGSTGAILAGAVLKVGRIRGIKRPALCPVMPTMNKTLVAICDSGANVEADENMLYQFGMMASLYMQKAFNVEKPRVALLNVGVEEEKGDALRKETYKLLKADEKINFVGNMESRDLLKGDYDVIVCDGFSGNVLCKSTEGACLEMLKLLKTTFTKSLKNKIGAAFLKKDIYALKDFMDYNNYGGAVLLGCLKTVVKAHGSSKTKTIYNCIKQAYNIEKNELRQSISAVLTENAE